MAGAFLLFLLASQASAGSKGFLSRLDLDPAYINLVIKSALGDVFGQGHGIQENRLTKINATLAPLFDALPKNQYGRLNARSMRYAVQRYFSQRHGWVIKGFEHHANHSDDNAHVEADIVRGKIPGYIEGVLAKTRSKGGFALADLLIMVATIEKLVFDETQKAMEASYKLNDVSLTRQLDEQTLMSILISYFILEYLGGYGSNRDAHLSDKKHVAEFYSHWKDTFMFLQDIVEEDAFIRLPLQNPFLSRMIFSFEDVTRIALTVSDRFGAFSNHECQDMKERIAKIDVHGTGRVKLSQFYATGQFLESPEYLEALGSLDTSSEWQGPQVIISNYLTGINNCISTGVYYDVCCLNECDGIFQHLEARIKGPTASAAQISQAIEEGVELTPHLSASAPTDPRSLSPMLQERLAQIEAHHDGRIPIHGRLLAQWLHYAFPRECPFPHLKGSVRRFYNVSLLSSMKVTQEVMVKHIVDESKEGRRAAGAAAPDAGAGMGMWIQHEELLDSNHLPQANWSLAVLRSPMYAIMILGMSALTLKELMRIMSIGTQTKQPGMSKATCHV